jgi:hypothetical protein
MILPNALELLRRHTPLPFGWCEVVVGYDFGILSIREIQDWVRTTAPRGPEAEHLLDLAGDELLRFEASLWATCLEATGTRPPRPGHRRWALAQDLWRTALLREALAWPLDEAAFGEAIATIIDRVGCPDDMHGLVRQGPVWTKRAASADRVAVEAFVARLEQGFLPREHAWLTLAAS